jgi:PAS domain S-box-containing protein
MQALVNYGMAVTGPSSKTRHGQTPGKNDMPLAESKANILLVDDHPANLLSLSAILEGLGQNLVEARSGEEALQKIKTYDFAVVLLDVIMPGIGGFETAKAIRSQERSRHTPIIFLTANDIDRAQLEEGYTLGAVDFLVKPLLPIALQSKVRGFVELFQDQLRTKRQSEQLRLLVQGTTEYAIFMLDPSGVILTWNSGAERLKGYHADEIIGQHFTRFYPPDAIERKWPQHELKVAKEVGRFEDEGWRIRKDGTQFWANVVITALRDADGELKGFSKVTRDLTERRESEENSRRLVEEEHARKSAEQILQSEQRFSRFMQHLPGLAWIKDVQGRYVYANAAAEKAFGTPRPDLYGKVDEEIFPPDTAAQFKENDQKALSNGGSGVQVIEALKQEGVIRYSLVSKFPITTPEGKVALIGGMAIDVTELRRVEEALRESEERFRGLMEQAPFSIQVLSADGFTIRVNPAWEELWGINFEQIADYNMLQDPQLEAKGIASYIRRAFAGESVTIPPIEYDPNETLPNRTRHKDPRRWVSAVAYPLKDQAGQVKEVILVHADITARRRAEEEREKFAFLVQNSHDFIGICDRDLIPSFINREGYRLVGLESMEEACRIPVREFFFPEDQAFVVETFLPRVLEDGYGEIEIRFRHFKTGEAIWMTFNVLAINDSKGERIGLATVSRNVSARKEVEDKLREADRRKDEFLATLAHELRNPLAPIRNSLQILKMPRVDPETAQQTRDMMDRQVHHLVRLVDDLLDVSRVMRGKIELRREKVELATVVARAVETAKPLIEVQGHQLDVLVPDTSLLLDADPVRLSQVIGNLLTNSAKYTEANGQIHVSAWREGDQAILSVRDNGIGIAPDTLPHVFELFVQGDHTSTKTQGGLGIGLTLVKNLVEMHGGSVEAHSVGLGKGSEFIVRLPLVAEALSPAATGATKQKSVTPSSGYRLLVVDDKQDAAISLSVLLRLHGHEVRVAHDGQSALELATEFQPDLIFLDIGMPVMDGYEVARRIRKTPSLQRIILVALTGWGQQEDRRRTSAAGFDHHLVKPAEPGAISAVLEELKSATRDQ